MRRLLVTLLLTVSGCYSGLWKVARERCGRACSPNDYQLQCDARTAALQCQCTCLDQYRIMPVR